MKRIRISSISVVVLPLLLLTGATGFGQSTRKPLPNGAENRIRVCGAHVQRTYVLPAVVSKPREVLIFPGGQQLVVEPSDTKIGSGESFAERYDYRIVLKPSGKRYLITSFAQNSDDSEDLAYRRLESIGVSCASANDIAVYFSFAVNGSIRDFFYLGMRMNMVDKPVALGRSVYGVLSLDRKDSFSFSIWDSSRVTAGNGMGEKHNYQVSNYRWQPGKQFVELLDKHNADPAYPAQILGQGERGIRVGEPKAE
jgi:hypothetical protein